jgi:ssDNA-binding Zn-finger/Zn-ribbon topoisomerase 1
MGDMADYYREQAEVYALEFGDDSREEAAWNHRENCPGTAVLRTNSKTREQFWGCSRFPNCKFTAPSPRDGWRKRRA